MTKVLDTWAGMTGTVLPFAGATAPTGWLMCYGQAVDRITYAALYAVLGGASSPWGQGDGSTTFNVPDMRDRVPAGKDDMGGAAAGRLTATLSGTRASTTNGVISALSSTAGLSIGMSAVGAGVGANAVINTIDSATQVTLTVNNTSTGTGNITFGVVAGATLGATGGAAVHKLVAGQMPSHTHTLQMSSNQYNSSSPTTAGFNTAGGAQGSLVNAAGSDQAHPNLQPTIILNSIIKV